MHLDSLDYLTLRSYNKSGTCILNQLDFLIYLYKATVVVKLKFVYRNLKQYGYIYLELQE